MVEKAKALTLSKAKRDDLGETGKYVSFTDENGNKAHVSLNQKAIDKDMQFAGYNLIITSEICMQDEDIYGTYHNLWRILCASFCYAHLFFRNLEFKGNFTRRRIKRCA
ncbi:MAG: hypothetical protein LBS53_13490 [Synergistaceae bacterium]|jgi:hypothetical protein|nr:hypothetical protein [Synergistaceae bacterium]